MQIVVEEGAGNSYAKFAGRLRPFLQKVRWRDALTLAQCAENYSRVGDRARDRADVIERYRQRDHALRAHVRVGGLQSYDPAESGRLADRAGCVAADGGIT